VGPEGDCADAARAHYPEADERGRLDTPFGQVEFARTADILEGHLPPPPATVAGVGGGPGRYALWLAVRGYAVHPRDLVPTHVEQLFADAASRGLTVDSRVCDARVLDLQDGSADAVLLPSRCRISRSGWTTRAAARPCSPRPATSAAFPSCSASRHTCSPPPAAL